MKYVLCCINLLLGGLRGTYQKAVFRTKFSKKTKTKKKKKKKKKKGKKSSLLLHTDCFLLRNQCLSKIATQFEGKNEIY